MNAILRRLILLCVSCWVWPGMISVRAADDHRAAPPRYLGASSCAASSCHGRDQEHDHRKSEFLFWRELDPHARDVLQMPSAQRISEGYGLVGNVAGQQQCLACHVTGRVTGRADLGELWANGSRGGTFTSTGDAVSCESCHGPAEKWLTRHYRADWRSLGSREKADLGFLSGRSDLIGRVRACAECHVGGPGREVDHDMLAAGHPRLNFEFSSHLGRLPKHWYRQSTHSIDSEATVWAVGQLITAEQALRQLAARSRDKNRAWPEYSEHSCYACHHELDSTPRVGNRRGADRGRGYSLSNWYVSMLPSILGDNTLRPRPSVIDTAFEKRLQAVLTGMQSPSVNRKRIGDEAEQLADALQLWASDVDANEIDAAALRRVLANATLPSNSGRLDWDCAAQWYLLAAAIHQEHRTNRNTLNSRPEQMRLSLHRMLPVLRFPGAVNSPRPWTGESADLLSREIRNNFDGSEH